MKYHVITLPFDPKREGFLLKEWEEFTQSHKILDCQAHFFTLHNCCYWTLWVAYEPRVAPLPQAPTEEALSPQQEALYEALKKWRRERAHTDGITSFLIAKNAELEAIARIQPTTASGLLGISGFGKKKVGKYGEDLLAIVDQFTLTPLKP